MSYLSTYQKMEREGKIGPTDEQGRLRPFQEYPKMIGKTERGVPIIVQSKRDELAHLAEHSPEAKDDPVVARISQLADENASLRAQLAKLSGSQGTVSTEFKDGRMARVDEESGPAMAIESSPELRKPSAVESLLKTQPILSPKAPKSGDK